MTYPLVRKITPSFARLRQPIQVTHPFNQAASYSTRISLTRLSGSDYSTVPGEAFPPGSGFGEEADAGPLVGVIDIRRPIGRSAKRLRLQQHVSREAGRRRVFPSGRLFCGGGRGGGGRKENDRLKVKTRVKPYDRIEDF